MKQNQAVEIDRLVKVIDERNEDLGKNARLGKEKKNPDSGGSHIVDREAESGSKPSGDAVRPWLTPPSPLSSPPPPPPPLWTQEKTLRTTRFKQIQRNTISLEQYRIVIKGTLWDGILTKRQKGKNWGK